MKKYTALLGMAVLGLSATASYAGITLQMTQANLTTMGAGDSTLADAGWVGYTLKLVTDGTSPGVVSYDFFNDGGGETGNMGIRGSFLQEWEIPKGQGSNQAAATSTPLDVLDGFDSCWITPVGGLLATTNAPAEDTNHLNGLNDFTKAPFDDMAATTKAVGYDYGVGSILTMSGALNNYTQSSVDVAFIIVPSSAVITIRGVAQDGTGGSTGVFALDYTIENGQLTDNNAIPDVPEPASLGLLALGGLSLLARRRRA